MKNNRKIFLYHTNMEIDLPQSPFNFIVVRNNQDLLQYKDLNINEPSRWSISNSFYKTQIDNCDIGIFITYMPLNFNVMQIAGFVLATFRENVMFIELLCARKYENKSSSFGQLLICMLYNIFQPLKIIVNGVNNENVSYYEHYGYVTESIKKHGHIMSIPNNVTTDEFFIRLNQYVDIKQKIFMDNLTREDLECA